MPWTSDRARGGPWTSRRVAVVSMALAGLLALGAFAFVVGRGGGAGPEPTVTPVPGAQNDPGDPSPPSTSMVRPADDPLVAARSWLRAYRSLSWTDPVPLTWVDRTRPFVTGALEASYRSSGNTTPGAQWASFVTRRCTAEVIDTGATVPGEAPRTPTSVYVQVVGTVRTVCGDDHPELPDELVAATVEVRQDAEGTWRVNRRVY